MCGLLGVAESSVLLSRCILDDNKSSVVSVLPIIHDLTTLHQDDRVRAPWVVVYEVCVEPFDLCAGISVVSLISQLSKKLVSHVPLSLLLLSADNN